MQYIPGVGENGILVHLGGSDTNGNLVSRTSRCSCLITYNSQLPLDSVNIFNINSLYNDSAGTWVSQATTGDIPISRVSGCVVMASAQDNSSHNMLVSLSLFKPRSANDPADTCTEVEEAVTNT